MASSNRYKPEPTYRTSSFCTLEVMTKQMSFLRHSVGVSEAERRRRGGGEGVGAFRTIFIVIITVVVIIIIIIIIIIVITTTTTIKTDLHNFPRCQIWTLSPPSQS
ncbi:hypothetical protein ElyMa_000301700 [Elysia marginata]|uniref:Uncharacterized protein n=1 Tax=Elysia marginata TaxID=1093978 RepID=A0AAV4F8B9_9GAST|nr:hypothetical protein ElyMa_000301700 [Elysia marginata]